MKKTIILIIAIMLTNNILSANATERSVFSDISNNHWAIDSINKLVSKRIISGYGDGTFKPNDNINIDAFIKLCVTALGHTNIKNGSSYWAENYNNKALELGLVEDGQFDKYNKIITREEIASIVMKAFGYQEERDNITKDFNFVKNSIKDYYNIDGRYLQDVVECYYYGLITGKSEGFDPKGNATRVEAVTVISRLLDASYRKPMYIPPTVSDNDIKKDDAGIYFDLYNNDKKLARIYECPNGENDSIKLMYGLDKAYKDIDADIKVSEIGTKEHYIGVKYDCLNKNSDSDKNISEVIFNIRHSKHDADSSYSISLDYNDKFSYSNRYDKYRGMFDTTLMYLYNDKFPQAKETVLKILNDAQHMNIQIEKYTVDMGDRDMYIVLNKKKNVIINISIKGGNILTNDKVLNETKVEKDKDEPCSPCMMKKYNVPVIENVPRDDKGIYFDVYRYADYKMGDGKDFKGRVYTNANGDEDAIKLMYAMDKVYQDNEGYVYVSQSEEIKKPIGVIYNCLDDINSTVDGTTTPIVTIIQNTEVSFCIKNANHKTGCSYNISLSYGKHDMTYMERYKKYETMFNTVLMYLYEDKFEWVKSRIIEALEIGEDMKEHQYKYTLKMNDREMFITINENHSVRFKISSKGGKIDHAYPQIEKKPSRVRD
jgi:hypothetical protein